MIHDTRTLITDSWLLGLILGGVLSGTIGWVRLVSVHRGFTLIPLFVLAIHIQDTLTSGCTLGCARVVYVPQIES
jgi:hypothetical protein